MFQLSMAHKMSFLLSCMFFLSLAIAHPSQSHSHDTRNGESSPFHFLKDLRGSVKGNKVEGLTKLKSYLKRFGYLRNQAEMNTNVFDDHLENAVKDYQRFYGLNVTGHLDESTVSLMMMPRCGMPDHFDGASSPHIGPNYALFPGKPRWWKANFTFSFDPSSRKDVVKPIAKAFNTWATKTPLGFHFAYTKDYNAADFKFSFQRRWHGDNQAFDGKYGVTAHGFAPQSGIAHFDEEEDWFISASGHVPGYKLDMKTVSMHEIGHLMGLQHSADTNAIMYAIINYGTSKSVTEDDRKGLIALYG